MRLRFKQTVFVGMLQTAVNPAGGPPEQLRFESRVVEQVRRLGGEDVIVALGRQWLSEEYVSALKVPPMWDVSELVIELDGSTYEDAFERVGPIFDSVLDYLMFVLQGPVRLGQLRAVDVTSPRELGEERSFWGYTGYPFDRYARNVALGAMATASALILPEHPPELPTAPRAALRWYTKSLETDLSHDAFIFLWIALECLGDASGLAVTAPYRADCGHEIESCPTCGRSTARKLRGATLRQFLVETGVSSEDARALWELRQMMHGAIPFDSHRLGRLAELLQVLRAAVALLLKQSLGIAPDEYPVVRAGQLSIHPAMGLGGIAPLGPGDVADLIS